MTAQTVTFTARAALLVEHDVFAYGNDEIRVEAVETLQGRLVEVQGTDLIGNTRWIDYGLAEEVTLVSGPTLARMEGEVRSTPRPSAVAAALSAVRAGRTRTLSVSANAVLYAAAAVCDEGVGIAHEGEIASAAGLASSTVRGILRSLESKGLVRRTSVGWSVA